MNRHIEFRRFINEYLIASGRSTYSPFKPPMEVPPDQPDYAALSVPRLHFVKFRNQYALLAEFAAFMCGTTVEKMTVNDLIDRLVKECEGDDAQAEATK